MTYIKSPNNDVTKIGQQKKSWNLKLERITNQKIQKLSKMHICIVKHRRLNTWGTHVPIGTKGLMSSLPTSTFKAINLLLAVKWDAPTPVAYFNLC